MRIPTSITLSGALLLILSVFTCCGSNEEPASTTYTQNNTSESQLLSSLNYFNDSIQVQPNSRGIGLAGWLSVALSDASGAYNGAKVGGQIGAIFGPNGATIGAVVGGVIVGTASSYNQYQLSVKIANLAPSINPTTNVDLSTLAYGYAHYRNEIPQNEYILGYSLGLDSCSVQIAICHNIILENIDLIVSQKQNIPPMYGLSSTEYQIIESKEFISKYDEITKAPETFNSDSALLSDQVMGLFVEAIKTTGTSPVKICTPNDLNQIVCYYASQVMSSEELSNEEKKWLLTGFAVLGYSIKFWYSKTIDFTETYDN